MEKNKEQIMLGITSDTEVTEMISVNVICRLCANQSDKLIGIYSEDGINNDLATKMNMYLPIKVNESDDLPLQCCWQCASTVLAWHDLVVTSVEAERRLRSYQFVAPKQLENVHVNFETKQNDMPINNVNNFETDRLPPKVIEKKNNLAITETCKKMETVCNISNISFRSETLLNKYIKYENNSDVTDIQYTRNNIDIDTHVEEPGVDTIEPQYTQIFIVQSDQRKIKYETAVDICSCTCLLCSLSFRTNISLKRHMMQKHKLKQQKLRRRKCEIDATFECFICYKSFTRKYDMEKHIINKHPNKKDSIILSKRASNSETVDKCKIISDEGTYFQCDLCESKFSWSQSFLRHRKNHSGEKLHCCHICGKKFMASTSLKRHIELLHYGLKQFSCNVCHKKFGVKTSRDEHMNTHTNQRPFMCDQCGKSFKQSSSLSVHKLFHSNIFKFSCVVCSKQFRRKSDLREHYWTHTKEKPYNYYKKEIKNVDK